MTSDKLLTPGDLKKVAEESQMAQAKKQLDRITKQEEEQKELREAFMGRDVHPQVKERVNAAVRRAAEAGLHEIQVMTFPANFTNDGGRRINNLEADWPASLEGFSKKALEYFEKELKPLGFKIRAQVLTYPGGMPGDVGLFLGW